MQQFSSVTGWSTGPRNHHLEADERTADRVAVGVAVRSLVVSRRVPTDRCHDHRRLVETFSGDWLVGTVDIPFGHR
ncbi:MAG: hypothetical protein V5A38_07880 [Halolamina sp.]